MSNKIKKQKIKKSFIEIKLVCKKIFCYILGRWGGVKCEDHPMPIIIIAALFMFLLFGGVLPWLGASIGGAISSFFESDQVEIPSEASLNDNDLDVQDKESSDLFKNCDFTSGQWDLWFGSMSRDVKDDTNYYFLNINEKSGLFKYSENISTSTDCVFKFIPRGDQVINYVISFDNFYQVVIGDNDYRTVSLRASEVIGGRKNPISESKTGKVRPKLSSVIKEGSLVAVTLQQGQTETNKYEVRVSIMYTPDSFEENETKTEDFIWQFVPSPILELSPLELSIGLIRGYGDKSNIGVNFISPAPNKTQ